MDFVFQTGTGQSRGRLPDVMDGFARPVLAARVAGRCGSSEKHLT
ncbi:hypothetical protein ACFQVD_42190 [Streptosporangium amethystogenes subsp. fukuiense]|uniref:Uncharacterized protein n=1 Tax=Streptosporangium amethystogenes subsp. fukuiense TaxID=698418 RepID=A0ABW2TEL2_9ACTN